MDIPNYTFHKSPQHLLSQALYLHKRTTDFLIYHMIPDGKDAYMFQ
jgi:hypothetical protein